MSMLAGTIIRANLMQIMPKPGDHLSFCAETHKAQLAPVSAHLRSYESKNLHATGDVRPCPPPFLSLPFPHTHTWACSFGVMVLTERLLSFSFTKPTVSFSRSGVTRQLSSRMFCGDTHPSDDDDGLEVNMKGICSVGASFTARQTDTEARVRTSGAQQVPSRSNYECDMMQLHLPGIRTGAFVCIGCPHA